MDFKSDTAVGKKIRAIRETRNWTQEELAVRLQIEGCDMTRSALAKIEAGQRHIYVDEIKAFKTALRVTYEELLG